MSCPRSPVVKGTERQKSGTQSTTRASCGVDGLAARSTVSERVVSVPLRRWPGGTQNFSRLLPSQLRGLHFSVLFPHGSEDLREPLVHSGAEVPDPERASVVRGRVAATCSGFLGSIFLTRVIGERPGVSWFQFGTWRLSLWIGE